MIKENSLEHFFTTHLQIDGFKKSRKNRTWYKKNECGTYFVLNLQKSQWSDSFFFNVGITYTGLEQQSVWNNKKPEWDATNTSSRVEMYDKNYESEIVQKLLGGVENNSDLNLIESIYGYIVTFFNKNRNKEEFKKNYYEYYMLDNVAIGSPLEDYCE